MLPISDDFSTKYFFDKITFFELKAKKAGKGLVLSEGARPFAARLTDHVFGVCKSEIHSIFY